MKDWRKLTKEKLEAQILSIKLSKIVKTKGAF